MIQDTGLVDDQDHQDKYVPRTLSLKIKNDSVKTQKTIRKNNTEL